MIEIFLLPGEYFVGEADYRIRTLLGSCVSITLWHPKRLIGAMSHCLLSSRKSREGEELDPRFAEEAIMLMLRDLEGIGISHLECQAKIFGGADMFPHQAREQAQHVGQQNGRCARALLQARNIPIVSESLFGVGYRQVIFDVASGNVWSRQVKPKLPATLTVKEPR